MEFGVDFDINTLFASLSYDMHLSFPDADANTPVVWGDTISAEVEYYYTDSSNIQRYYTTQMYFNSAAIPQFDVLKGVGNTVSFTSSGGSSGTSGSISAQQSTVTLNAGGAYYFDFSHGYTDKQTCTFLQPNKGSIPAILETGTGSLLYAGRIVDLNYTTSPSVHDRLPNSTYMPISGQRKSYNDLKLYVVDEWNNQNPSETISIDDIPDYEEETTEQETGEIQPFSIDYDEILGERELESILAETRYILDTTPYEIESVDYAQAVSEPYEELKRVAVLDADTKTAMSTIYDVSIAMTESQFLPLYAFGAILSVVMWFVFRR